MPLLSTTVVGIPPANSDVIVAAALASDSLPIELEIADDVCCSSSNSFLGTMGVNVDD